MKKPMMTTKELSEAGVTRIVMPENVPTVSEEYQRGYDKDRQKVSLARWDKHSPPWDRMGECIVIGQRKTHGCESGWMVKVMAKDGTYRELDSHWLEQPNEKS
jgi:hypothetical protein